MAEKVKTPARGNTPVAPSLDEQRLLSLARRVKGKYGYTPSGVPAAEFQQDVCVAVLQAHTRLSEKPAHVNDDQFIVQRAWGMLKDQYTRKHRDNQRPTEAKSVEVESHEAACDRRMDVEAALDKVLTPAQADVVRAVILGGQSQAEYARERGVSEASVSYLMARVRDRFPALREALAEYGDIGLPGEDE